MTADDLWSLYLMSQQGTTKPEGVAPDPAERRPSIAARRRFLLTGGLASMPMIATLASRPALATTAACTISKTLSNNPSFAPTANCGVSPGCWKNQAASDGQWQSTSYSPGQSLTAVPALGALNRGQWQTVAASGGNTLINALNGNVHAVCTLKDGKTHTIKGSGFLSQCIAALLNADFFNRFTPPRYPLTVSGVQSFIENNLNLNPGSPGQPIADKQIAQANASAITDYFASLITDGYPCGKPM